MHAPRDAPAAQPESGIVSEPPSASHSADARASRPHAELHGLHRHFSYGATNEASCLGIRVVVIFGDRRALSLGMSIGHSQGVVRRSGNVHPPGDLQARVLREGEDELVLLAFTPSGCCALTDAECRVAIALTRGYSNAQIARAHGVSTRTIANQVAAILKKLGAGSRSEVAATFGIADLR
ncbi:MAG TPA: helix-turn-helix transcriptional regulator [Kofleriaceae bacterium]|nr:helix-turn-helix transcriptional regulator [Kofleriaceae bacterium]